MVPPEREIVESAIQGDPQALGALLERYLPGLEAFVRLRSGRLLLTKESGVDIVQSVCREVLTDLRSAQYETEAHFKHWLYMAAMRKIANRYEYYRAAKRTMDKEVRPHGDVGDPNEAGLLNAYRSVCTPSRNMAMKEELERVERAFSRLPPDYREVILLSRIVGLPHAEIAKKLDRNEGAVRVLLSRALSKLSALLDRNDADPDGSWSGIPAEGGP